MAPFHPNVYKYQERIRGLRERPGTELQPEDAIITPEDYSELAARTRGRVGDEALCNAALGLAGEAGEVADLIKKELFHEHEPEPDKVQDEIGDLLWYTAWIADEYGFTLTEAMQGNIKKLRRRYPEGFDPERSRNREA